MAARNSHKSLLTLNALAEPNRKAIVELLRDGPMTVGEIAERLELRQPQASKHLKVLTMSELLEVKADANRRFYKLRPEPFLELDSWLKGFQRIMEERYDQLEDYLENLQKKDADKNKK